VIERTSPTGCIAIKKRFLEYPNPLPLGEKRISYQTSHKRPSEESGDLLVLGYLVVPGYLGRYLSGFDGL
jgi:hypothetical protein